MHRRAQRNMMSRVGAPTQVKSGERGSAFVISILVLFVLSVLGLALMLTTTTETDISVNYRYGEMAFFNADAALEYGKNVLASYAVLDGDFVNALPPPRGPSGPILMDAPPIDAAVDCGDTSVPGCRDYQYFIERDANVRIYIGRVLRDPVSNLPIQFDFRDPGNGIRGDIDEDGTIDIEGTVTLWVRRPLAGDQDYGYDTVIAEGVAHDRVILTAEGTAPNWQGAQGGRPGSLRRLEMTVRIPSSGASGDRYADVTKGSDTDAIQGSDAAQASNTTANVQ